MKSYRGILKAQLKERLREHDTGRFYTAVSIAFIAEFISKEHRQKF